MKRFIYITVILFFTGVRIYAQEAILPVRVMAMPKDVTQRFVGTDAFGWDYTITDNEFQKQKDGRTLRYKNVALGEIYQADLQNPLQIVLFYRRFNTVVLLDNQLNQTRVINFSDLAYPVIAEAVGLASQNRLWLYDVTTQQVGLYDLARETFRTITPPFNDGIKYYQSDYNYFYSIDNAGKCFVLNLFSKVIFLGTVPLFDAAQVLSNTDILLQKDNGLYLYNMVTQSIKPIQIVEKSFGAFYYNDQILSIFTDSEIVKYKITLPR